MSLIRNAAIVVLVLVVTILLASSQTPAATNCSATFTAEARIVVPYATYAGIPFSSEFSYGGYDNCSLWFNLTKLDLVNDPSLFAGCEGAVLTSDLSFRIPDLQIGGIGFSVDLQYMPASATAIPFKLIGINALAASSVADFVIASGQTVELTSDLTINASGSVQIAGTLSPSTHTGQSVTIIAEGDIVISGTVAAGNGFPGGPGGSVTIYSKNGNITITDTASVQAGDGAKGIACSSTQNIITAQGGNGGSVFLKAPKGTLTLANKDGLIHVGNGGHSPDVRLPEDSSAASTASMQGAMRPGHSGLFEMTAAGIAGLSYQTTVVSHDIIDPCFGLPIYKAGTALNIPSPSNRFSGGRGGNGGAFAYGFNGQTPSSSVASAHAVSAAARIASTRSAAAGEHPDLLKEGDEGGWGIFSGGKGADVELEGKAGIFPGGKGQSVTAIGGKGGTCIFFDCTVGEGGKARAVGGKGARGSDPAGSGGDGGKAVATGGSSPGGRFGQATAIGGEGGRGGGACPANVVSEGGPGGCGGDATATAISFNSGANLAGAIGGKAGDGGDGLSASGAYACFGKAEAVGDIHSAALSGSFGIPGTTCPSAGVRPPESTEIPGTYTLSGTKASDDCPTPYPERIANPSVPITASGNTVTVHSSAAVTGEYIPDTGLFSGTGVTAGQVYELIAGYFQKSATVVKLVGSLLFKPQTGPQKDCTAQYAATYTKN